MPTLHFFVFLINRPIIFFHNCSTFYFRRNRMQHPFLSIIRVVAILAAFTCVHVAAQGQLSEDIQNQIDRIAGDALASSGVPSASVAVVKNGQVAYIKAYGNAKLDPQTAARPDMRYSIGSISKQFTATAILLLQEQGKLSLDDK